MNIRSRLVSARRRAATGKGCRRAAWALVSCWLAAGGGLSSAFAGTGCDDLSGTPIHVRVDWQLEVKPIFNELLGGRCTSCHNSGQASGGLDLTDANIDAIYKIVGNQVQPGDPVGSLLFDKVNCAFPEQGSQMPFGQNPLSILQRELVYDWIEQGAYGEDPQDPINRDFIYRDGLESDRIMRP